MAIEPNRIACRDGVVFYVRERATGAIVLSALRDDSVSQACGLWRYRTAHRDGELYAEHENMPVEVARAYALGHGGVAEGGPVAIALLKRLPSEANQGAQEVAPSAGFRPDAGGSRVAGRPEASAPAGAPAQRDGGGPAALEVDVLTPEIIDARRFLAVLDGPHLLDGREPTTDAEALRVWQNRGSIALRAYASLAARLGPGSERHPLYGEAVALRDRAYSHVRDTIPHTNLRAPHRQAG